MKILGAMGDGKPAALVELEDAGRGACADEHDAASAPVVFEDILDKPPAVAPALERLVRGYVLQFVDAVAPHVTTQALFGSSSWRTNISPRSR